MPSSVNTNMGALVALQSLQNTQASLVSTQKRISTGLRVADTLGSGADQAVAQSLQRERTTFSFDNQGGGGPSQGLGALVDADMARESAQLQAMQVNQQLGAQALSIANQAPQAFMKLFG